MSCGCINSKLLLWLYFISLWNLLIATEDGSKKYAILMPDVVPRQAEAGKSAGTAGLFETGTVPVKLENMDESYLCTAVRLDPTEEYYITAFEPNATKETAHHMLLFGCSEPGSMEHVWSCGDMAKKEHDTELGPTCKKNSQIAYAWAKDAPKLILPEGVGFKVGGKTDIKYLVLQVHYATVEKFTDGSTDDSGVVLTYTKVPQPKLAGVLLMGTGGRILPHSIEYMETACPINENIVIHPFAFRTHTHSLGRVVSGYKVAEGDRGPVWTLIGKKDPQLPQMFYPVPYDMTLSKGDMIAARCTMESTRDRVTRVGLTADDEMCNFYIMYWKDAKQYHEKLSSVCFSLGPPYYYWDKVGLKKIPDDASSLPVGESTNEINPF